MLDLERKWERYEPMFRQLAADQAYRARWLNDRNKSRSRWARRATWAVGIISGLAVVAASLAELVHLL